MLLELKSFVKIRHQTILSNLFYISKGIVGLQSQRDLKKNNGGGAGSTKRVKNVRYFLNCF
jgi:hypothetical protein